MDESLYPTVLCRCNHLCIPYINADLVKHQERHGCVVSTVATDALVLKHQAIIIHNADWTFIVLDKFHIKILHIRWTASESEITFWKKWPSHLRVNRCKQKSPGGQKTSQAISCTIFIEWNIWENTFLVQLMTWWLKGFAWRDKIDLITHIIKCCIKKFALLVYYFISFLVLLHRLKLEFNIMNIYKQNNLLLLWVNQWVKKNMQGHYG